MENAGNCNTSPSCLVRREPRRSSLELLSCLRLGHGGEAGADRWCLRSTPSSPGARSCKQKGILVENRKGNKRACYCTAKDKFLHQPSPRG